MQPRLRIRSLPKPQAGTMRARLRPHSAPPANAHLQTARRIPAAAYAPAPCGEAGIDPPSLTTANAAAWSPAFSRNAPSRAR